MRTNVGTVSVRVTFLQQRDNEVGSPQEAGKEVKPKHPWAVEVSSRHDS